MATSFRPAHRPRTGLRRVALTTLAALVLAAGCTGSASSGDDEAASSTTTAAASTAPAVPDPEPTSDDVYGPGWSAVHADGANSDHSAVAGADDVTQAWRRSFDSEVVIRDLEWTINLGPTSDDQGNLYLTTSVAGCHLQVLDTATGETRWCAEEVGAAAVGSSPLLDVDGRAFLADGERMLAFDRDGTVLWEQPIVGVPFSAQFTPGGRVLFITHVGVVYVLDRETGDLYLDPVELVPDPAWDPSQPLWACARGTEGCPSANTVAVHPSDGSFYFTFWEPGASQAGVRAMRLHEGADPAITPLWTNDTLPGGSGASPALSSDGRRVYLTDNVDSVHALDAETGATVWSHEIGVGPGGSMSVSPDGLLIPAGGPLLAIEDLGDTSQLVWRNDDLVNRGIATQAAGGKVYATVARAGVGNDLVVVDVRTGEVLDREPLEGDTRFSVGITVGLDGTVFVPMIVGDLFAFRTE